MNPPSSSVHIYPHVVPSLSQIVPVFTAPPKTSAPTTMSQDQTLAPRRPRYLSLAVRAAFVRMLPVAVASLFGDPRPSAAGDRVQEVPPPPPPPPPSSIPGIRLDPVQVAAAAEAIRQAIDGGTHPITSLVPSQDDPSDPDWSSSDDDDDERSRPVDQHFGYPLIKSLKVGGAARLFVPGSTMLRRGAARQGEGACSRLSDVQESPWNLKAGGETFARPCELTNESTRIWVLMLKITTKLVGLIKRELQKQNPELCEELIEECFAQIAGQSLDQIIELACSFCDARWSDGHMSQQLTVFDALLDVSFSIRGLCSNRSGEVAGIINKMVNSFKGVIQRTSNGRHGSKEYTIHHATAFFTRVLEFFYRNRDMVQQILESEGYNTNPCSDMVNCWLSKIKEDADTMFEEKGKRYIFILNNTYFILEMNCHPGLLLPSVARNLDALIEQYIMSYLDQYWFPPMLSYLDGDSLKKPRRSTLHKFTEEFFRICDHQKTWKVQTEIKKILREEIMNLIVSKYVEFSDALQANPNPRWPSWLKGVWGARSEKPEYTGAHLTEVIQGLFER